MYGNGDTRSEGLLPGGLRPDISCTIKRPETRCSLRFYNTQGMAWQISSRDVWTDDAAIAQRLGTPGNEVR